VEFVFDIDLAAGLATVFLARGPEVGDKESSETALLRGLGGEFDNIRIRLRGLGLAGEYA
jgi:hypothetical protein